MAMRYDATGVKDLGIRLAYLQLKMELLDSQRCYVKLQGIHGQKRCSMLIQMVHVLIKGEAVVA